MISKTFLEDDELTKVANLVIKEHSMDWLSGLKLKFVLVSPNISKTVVGKCIKPNHELRYFGKFDYLVEFSDDVWKGLTTELRSIVLYHELLHISVTQDAKGNEKHKVLDHNIKDFTQIVKIYGVDWINKLKTIVSSVRDLEPKDQDKIKV